MLDIVRSTIGYHSNSWTSWDCASSSNYPVIGFLFYCIWRCRLSPCSC